MKRLALLFFFLSVPYWAIAQLRTIPSDATRGKMSHLQNMDVEIDGAKQRLAPGAQIRNASNLIILPTAIPARAEVKYTLDGDRRVKQVWILTPEEAKKR